MAERKRGGREGTKVLTLGLFPINPPNPDASKGRKGAVRNCAGFAERGIRQEKGGSESRREAVRKGDNRCENVIILEMIGMTCILLNYWS